MYFVEKFVFSAVLSLAFFWLTSGFSFGKENCEEECGGEKAHDEILLKGEISCYIYKSWFFGMKDAGAATECEINKCKKGYGVAENQTECWCTFCKERGLIKDDLCFGIGEGVLDRESRACYNYFCHGSSGDARPVYYYGKYCNRKYKHLAP